MNSLEKTMTQNHDLARKAAEEIHRNNELVRGGYETPHTTEAIILRTLESAQPTPTDTERLDWLDKHISENECERLFNGTVPKLGHIRAAIDAAMKHPHKSP